jgi:hypothetical protein
VVSTCRSAADVEEEAPERDPELELESELLLELVVIACGWMENGAGAERGAEA